MLRLRRPCVHVALCDCHGSEQRVVVLVLMDVQLLIVGVADGGLARVGERVDIQAVREVIDVRVEVQQVLVQVETERGLVQLDLVQNVLWLEVKRRLRLLYHHLIRQLLCLSIFGVDSYEDYYN